MLEAIVTISPLVCGSIQLDWLGPNRIVAVPLPPTKFSAPLPENTKSLLAPAFTVAVAMPEKRGGFTSRARTHVSVKQLAVSPTRKQSGPRNARGGPAAGRDTQAQTAV